MAKTKNRFKRIHIEGVSPTTEIWVDTKTGVNYLFHAEGYAGGLTVLVDKDGKPIVTPEYIDETIGFSVE